MSTAHKVARTVLNGFHAMFADFQNVTLAAKARFEQADWQAIQQAQSDRLEVYQSKVNGIIPMLRTLAAADLETLSLWRDTKASYTELIANYANFEIAETFYNSVFCKVFAHRHIDDRYCFVHSSRSEPPATAEHPVIHSYELVRSLPDLIRRILGDYDFSIPYEHMTQDVRNITRTVLEEIIPGQSFTPGGIRVDVLDPVFYRNKGAYLVGRIVGIGSAPIPFVLPILHNERGGVYVDTLIHDPDEVSIIFSFTRSYFMVDAPVPSQIVDFLQGLMPHKKRSELYASIGFRKHSKTEFFRDFVNHLAHSDDQFVVAPGIKGMVMAVFTLPSYDIVFKIIKDRFAPPKEVTREIVEEKYRLVTRHDRVGRMADTQEIKGLHLPRSRFSPELLAELERDVPSQLELANDEIIIRHVYTERRMVPLNLYLRDATVQQVHDVMDEYGNAIKQLAAANIFPGDMLLKNFGVTRHGRVVFYDYDEISHLTECNFRDIPEPRTDEEALSPQPWYTVGPNDIFPEEFRLFFSGNPEARAAFDELHADLYQASFWRNLQERIRAGQVVDVFPYRRVKRFAREAAASATG